MFKKILVAMSILIFIAGCSKGVPMILNKKNVEKLGKQADHLKAFELADKYLQTAQGELQKQKYLFEVLELYSEFYSLAGFDYGESARLVFSSSDSYHKADHLGVLDYYIPLTRLILHKKDGKSILLDTGLISEKSVASIEAFYEDAAKQGRQASLKVIL